MHTNEGIDSLRFNGGRLDGRFIRTKGNKQIIEGFYKMGVEDSIWTLRDSISNDKVVQTFVNGETIDIKRYSDNKLTYSKTVNTRSDTIVNIYIQLSILILCLASICFILYGNKRKNISEHFKLKLFWKLLLCFVVPLIVWLFYTGIMLLLMNYSKDIFETLATGIFIFITVFPLMFIIIFWIKLSKEIDIFLYVLVMALAFSIYSTWTTLEALLK